MAKCSLFERHGMFGQGFVEAFRKRDTFYEQTALALIFIIPKDKFLQIM